MSLLPLTDLSCLSNDTVWSCIQKKSAVKRLASHAMLLGFATRLSGAGTLEEPLRMSAPIRKLQRSEQRQWAQRLRSREYTVRECFG